MNIELLTMMLLLTSTNLLNNMNNTFHNIWPYSSLLFHAVYTNVLEVLAPHRRPDGILVAGQGGDLTLLVVGLQVPCQVGDMKESSHFQLN